MRAFLLLLALLCADAHAQLILLRGGGSAGTGPVPNSAAAAKATAEGNPVCTEISPFYIQLNGVAGYLWSDAVNVTQPTWSASTVYIQSNRVNYLGQTYVALSSNVNKNPASQTTYWLLLTPIASSTSVSIASASKMVYGAYAAVALGGYSNFTTADQTALNFTDGYANMGSVTNGSTCPGTTTGNYTCGSPPVGTTDSINNCLLQCGIINTSQLMNWNNPALIGYFDYDSAHEEQHASVNQTRFGAQGIANLGRTSLYPAFASAFGISSSGSLFTEPLLAGGIYTTASNFIAFLAAYVGSATMRSILPDNASVRTNSVVTAYCTDGTHVGPGQCPSGSVNSSPIGEKWDYGVAYWWEVDTSNNNDFSVSSPGAFGFYPFITPTCPAAGHTPGNFCTTLAEFTAAGANPWTYYGVVSLQIPTGTSPTGNGQQSGQCAALVRYAYAYATPLLTQTIPP